MTLIEDMSYMCIFKFYRERVNIVKNLYSLRIFSPWYIE